MRFSVVISTYNRADIVRKVLAALAAQTYTDYEVVLVDDGSTDNTREVAMSYPIVRYMRQPHQASPRLFNIGWRSATGDIILMSDDDYVSPPNLIEGLADGFRRYPEAVAVGGYACPPDELMATNRFARYDDWEWRFYGGRLAEYVGGAETPTAGAVAYRRSALEEIGGFDENLLITGSHDYDIKQRLTARGYKFVYLPIKIDHYKLFTAHSFHGQHIGRGRAVARYEFVKQGRGPGLVRIGLRVLKRAARLIKHLVTMRDKALAWTIFEAEWFNCIGQYQEQATLRQDTPHAKQIR